MGCFVFGLPPVEDGNLQLQSDQKSLIPILAGAQKVKLLRKSIFVEIRKSDQLGHVLRLDVFVLVFVQFLLHAEDLDILSVLDIQVCDLKIPHHVVHVRHLEIQADLGVHRDPHDQLQIALTLEDGNLQIFQFGTDRGQVYLDPVEIHLAGQIIVILGLEDFLQSFKLTDGRQEVFLLKLQLDRSEVVHRNLVDHVFLRLLGQQGIKLLPCLGGLQPNQVRVAVDQLIDLNPCLQRLGHTQRDYLDAFRVPTEDSTGNSLGIYIDEVVVIPIGGNLGKTCPPNLIALVLSLVFIQQSLLVIPVVFQADLDGFPQGQRIRKRQFRSGILC